MVPRSFRSCAATLLTALVVLLPATAWAQSRSFPTLREEILGYDPAQGVLAFVTRTPSRHAGFDDISIVEVRRDGSEHRIPLTTDADGTEWVGTGRGDATTRSAIEARVARDLASNRARYRSGTVYPVSLQGGTQACTRPPFASRRFSVGDAMAAQVNVASDGTATVALASGNRSGQGGQLPAVTLTYNGQNFVAPYDTIADVRELPGTDRFAVLLRSNACTPEGTHVPVHALLLAPPPPPEQALTQLPHAELEEMQVMHALFPHAHRRTVDEVASYYDGRARVVFDTAWTLPTPGNDTFLVQYTRIDPDMPPPVVDAGQAYAAFAIMQRDAHGRMRVRSQVLPPTNQNVFEGSGQEAYAADLDGDGRPELVVRATYRPAGEIATLLRWGQDDSVQFVWRTAVVQDERASNPSVANDVRHCTLGVDSGTLVVRCNIDQYPAGSGANAAPTATTRLIQRVRWNGGALSITEERH